MAENPAANRSGQVNPEDSARGKKQNVRVGLVQWQMRATDSVDAVLRKMGAFVEALESYGCDVALFPEFFSAPLMGLEMHASSLDAIEALASFSARIQGEASLLAVKHGIDIVAGSMPVVRDGSVYNVSYLCRRDGTVDSQDKLHPTPGERHDWNIVGGNELKVFNMDFGRVGILVCYDVEFPELARLLAEEGVDLLLVPFWTDNKSGFLRVMRCAQARAIENECYVAISGSVGCLPEVLGLDVQYAQSAVFSPSDFGFPHDGVVAETTPNTEMTLVAELDLGKLNELRKAGSVQNSLDRRRDLYRTEWTGPGGALVGSFPRRPALVVGDKAD